MASTLIVAAAASVSGSVSESANGAGIAAIFFFFSAFEVEVGAEVTALRFVAVFLISNLGRPAMYDFAVGAVAEKIDDDILSAYSMFLPDRLAFGAGADVTF